MDTKDLTDKHKSLLRLKKKRLIEGNHNLTAELTEEEGANPTATADELQANPQHNTSIGAQKPTIAPRPTIKTLRKNPTLLKCDNTIRDWLPDSDLSDENQETMTTHKPRGKRQPPLPIYVSDRIGQDDIFYPIKWPHLAVLNIDGTEKLRFKDLSIYKLAAGEMEIIMEHIYSCFAFTDKNSDKIRSEKLSTDKILSELQGRLCRLEDTIIYIHMLL